MQEITFNKYIQHYFYNFDSRSRGQYIREYEEVIKNIIKPEFKNFKLKNITPTQLNIFKNYCARHYNNKKDIRYREAYFLLVDAVEYARRNNLITNNEFLKYSKKLDNKKKQEEIKNNTENIESKDKLKKDYVQKLTHEQIARLKYNKLKNSSGLKHSSSYVLDSKYLNPNQISFKIDDDNEIKKLQKQGRLQC